MTVHPHPFARRVAEAALAAAAPPVAPEPMPLFREQAQAEPFPLGSLSPTLRAGVEGIVGHVQCPPALAANSVLAAASLIAQAHVDVRTLAGSTAPTSLFVITVAASGERKSSADALAMRPVTAQEATLRQAYNALAEDHRVRAEAWDVSVTRAKKTPGNSDTIAKAIRAVGPRPAAPVKPVIVCGEPTWEGLWLLLSEGPGFAGVMSAEGGAFFGGHAMAPEAKLRTAAGLSELWDGAPVRRVRRGDGVSVLPGRRVALHLLAQVETARSFLADRLLLDQGLLSRILVAAPTSTMGERMYRDLEPAERAALEHYHSKMAALFARDIPRSPGDAHALSPRTLELEPGAREALIAFADAVEEALRPDGELRQVSGHAAKLAEQASRIAGVMTFVESPHAEEVGTATMEAAIELANWYGAEALKLLGVGRVSPSILAADTLHKWLIHKWKRPIVTVREVVQFGPNTLRTAAAARAALAKLAAHGWVSPDPDAGGNSWRLNVSEGGR